MLSLVLAGAEYLPPPPPGEEGELSPWAAEQDLPTTWAEHTTVSWPSCSSSCATWAGGPGVRSPPGAPRTLFPNLWLGSKAHGHCSPHPNPVCQLMSLPTTLGSQPIPGPPQGLNPVFSARPPNSFFKIKSSIEI